MKPPRLAAFITRCTCGPHDREAVLGDLAEEFHALTQSRGRVAAWRWYWRQALTSAVPNFRRRFQGGQPYLVPQSRSSAMSNLIQDLKFAWRLLRRRPGLPAVAGFSMVAGIALTAIVFSLLDAAVLRPLPVSDPDSLVVVLSKRESGVNHNFSYPDLVDYRADQRAFADMTGVANTTATIASPSGALIAEGEMVSGSYFPMLGVRISKGRGIVDTDVVAGAAPVVVVSEALWEAIAGPGAAFDGRVATINGQPFGIIGVVSKGFKGSRIGRNARFWVPLSQQPVMDSGGGQPYWERRTVSWLTVLARLKPNASMADAETDLNRVEAVLGPSVSRQEQRTLQLAPGRQGDSFMPAATADPLRLLLWAALLVLLVATANVANLLTTRASDRQRELAVRAALGAGRGRLIRLLVAEAVIIGCGSSALAFAITAWLAGVVVPLLPGLEDPAALDVGATWRVAAFVAVLGLATTMLASVVPMIRLWRGSTGRALAEAGRASSGAPAAQRLRHALVVVQFALSLALVVTSALLIRTLFNVRGIPTGLAIDQVALLEVNPESAGYDPARIRQYYADAIERLGAVPGVTNVAYGRIIPVGIGGSRVSVVIPDYTPKPDEDMEINYNVISPGYFDALGISLVAGRAPSDADRLGMPVVVVVNDTMARRYWPNGDAIGRTFRFGGATGPVFEVVGIARDVKYRTLREEAAPSFYYSVNQSQRPRNGVMHVRTGKSPDALLPVLRKTLADLDAAVPVATVRTLREQRDRNAADEELAMTIGVVLGSVALLLAAVGLFAAMSASVVRRTREIGVRMALGANPGRIVGLVLSDSLRLVFVGAALGLALAYWIGQFVRDRLFGVGPNDPVSFGAGVAVLALVALVAGFAPARRASRVDPIEALRTD